MIISDKERKLIVRVIGRYQDFLEQAIHTALAPGETKPREDQKANVTQDRKRWREAEDIVMLLAHGSRRLRQP